MQDPVPQVRPDAGLQRSMNSLRDFWVEQERDAERMWESWNHAHRKHVLNALVCLPAPGSLYELGCGSGPNLRLVRQAFPKMRLGGSEPNGGLAAHASQALEISIERAEFPYAPGPEWDVTLSCYALAYADPSVARETLANIGTRHLILIEPCAWVAPYGPPNEPPGYYAGVAMPHCAHDYLAMTRDTGWTLTWRWPIYPNHQGLNMVLVAERT